MKDYLEGSFLGVSRGLVVHSLIYPLEVIKLHQQLRDQKSYHVAMKLFNQEGMPGFYKGILPQLYKTSTKQIWCWPLITEFPLFLQSKGIHPILQQGAAGLTIATIDAAISLPLEKWKIQSALGMRATTFSWNGFTTHWAKLSVNWISFLVAQKLLRDHYNQKQELTFKQYVVIGVQVALIVSTASAPFDFANTYKQSQNVNIFSKVNLSAMYRGSPLSSLSLIIHNIASVTLIDYLNQRRNR